VANPASDKLDQMLKKDNRGHKKAPEIWQARRMDYSNDNTSKTGSLEQCT